MNTQYSSPRTVSLPQAAHRNVSAIGRATEDVDSTENDNPWAANDLHNTPTKASAEARVRQATRQVSGIREHKAPLGPRPPDFVQRRVISEAPVSVTATPRRSYLPNATSEPFLGLSARRKTSQIIPVTQSNQRKKEIENSLAGLNGHSTPTVKARVGARGQQRIPSKDSASAVRGDVAGSLRRSDLRKTPPPVLAPLKQRNPALRATQISSTSSFVASTITPLTIRTRRASQYPGSGSESSEINQARKVTGPDLIIKSTATKNNPENAMSSHFRTPQTNSTKTIARTPSNSTSRSLLEPLSPTNAGAHGARAPQAADKPATYRAQQQRLDPMAESIEEEIKATHRVSQTPRRAQQQIPTSDSRRMSALPAFSGGGLARARSPTDARRQRGPNKATSPTPELTFEARPGAARSPSLVQQQLDTPSSNHLTPEVNNRLSIGRSLSSHSSYSSLQPSSAMLQNRTYLSSQISRNSSIRSRDTRSPTGDRLEVVPPVPAIPKAFGTPRENIEEPFFFNFDDSSTRSDPVTVHHNLRANSNAHAAPEPMPEAQPPLYDHRHRRGLAAGNGTEPRNFSLLEHTMRHTSPQPMRLAPLNVQPLGEPMNSKIESLTQRKPTTPSGEPSSPLPRKVVRLPGTPQTASKATFAGHSAHEYDLNSYYKLRSNTSQAIPQPASSRSSSRDVFLTPSPSASRASSSPMKSNSAPPVPLHSMAGPPRDHIHSVSVPVQTSDVEAMVVLPSASNTPAQHMLHTQSQSSRSTQEEQVVSHDKKAPYMKQPRASASSVTLDQPPRLLLNGYNGDSRQTSQIGSATAQISRTTRVLSTVTNDVEHRFVVSELISGVTSPNVAPVAQVPKGLSSKPSHSAMKLKQLDAMTDMEDLAADEEMVRLASKRKDHEAAARELDELKRRASAKHRMSPDEASHSANLNIFERGEIVDYKEVYFCGSSRAQKFVGDLSAQVTNFGFDDERGDYNIVMADHLAYRYEVVDLLGKGSFGQVVRCVDHKTGTLVAVKIIRNKKRFHQQALVEVNILRQLREWDPRARHSMIKFTHSFYFRGHLCISTELLGMNLYEFIKAHEFRGFSLNLIRRFAKQMLSSLCLLQTHNVIHCDLKPENILLAHPLHSELKVIDFGSSCFVNEKVYTYIQSRFYRSPEVILGLSYGMPIDMWSLGCILAELLTGYPIFPGENEQEQLACIMEVFGPPEKHLVEACTRKKVFFDSQGKPRPVVSTKGKRRRASSKTLSQALKCDDEAFLDFITRCLRWDPDRRLKPDEATAHEFVLGAKKRVRPIALSVSSASPAKRSALQTPAKGRPLPDVPVQALKSGSAAAGRLASPSKSTMPVRRHSTINQSEPPIAAKRTSTGLNNVTSALPRAVPRSASGRPDLASAAAIASLRQK